MRQATRRDVLAGGALLGGAFAGGAVFAGPPRGGLDGIVNPVVRQRADAQVFRHTDGWYYMTASVPEYDRLVLRRSRTLAGLGAAQETVIWRRPLQGRMAGYIWAPELHWINGAWAFFFAAGDGDDKFRIRTYALRGEGVDPFAAHWALAGQLQTPWDSFTLDSTSFFHQGRHWLAWAQREPGMSTNSNLYLAPLASLTTLAVRPVRLSVPELAWEVRGFKVNEAPAVLIRHGRVFVTYSASATDARYCMGMLSAPADANLLDPQVWHKSPEPVFASSPAHRVWGPGHNSFTVDEAGRDMLVYHARDYEAITGDPLFDPNRHTRVQPIHYRADGVPDFGEPVAIGPLL